MILEIQQHNIHTTLAYRCTRNGETICDVIIPAELRKRTFYFNFMKKNENIELIYAPWNKEKGTDVVSRFAKDIYCNGEPWGYIASTKTYGLFEVKYKGNIYMVYNYDSSQMCCQVVKNEMGQVVAEIERHTKPYKQLDHYTAYTENEDLEELLCMLAVNIDFMEYSEVYSGEIVITNGYRGEGAKDLVDVAFMEKIAKAEGFDRNKEPDIPVEPTDWNFPEVAANKENATFKTKSNIMWVVLAAFVFLILNFLMNL